MCNGLVEKFNGTLKGMLKRLCSEQPKQWNRYINALLFAYREVPQASTGLSPFELLYGRTVRGPMAILKELWTEEFDESEVKTSYQYVIDLREKLEQTLKLVHDELKKSQARYQRYYNRNAKDRKFVVGDKVLILLPTDKNKLLMQWKGPFKVEKTVGTNDYGIQIDGKVKTFHANMLKKYIERETAEDINGHEEESEGDDNGDDKDVGGSILHLTAASIIETTVSGTNGAIDDEELLELGPTTPNETAAYVVLGEQLSEEQRVQLEDLIDRYEHIFTDVPGDSNLTEHQIELTSEEPVRSKPYVIPCNVRESLKEDIQAMLQMGVIRESKSPYASPVVVVRKKDGTNRVKAYMTLKRELTSEPILHLPDSTRPFVLRTDASDVGIGAVLKQDHNGKLFPVSYAGKKLLPRECKYSAIERECLAIVWAIQKFRVYLYGREFILQTDHQPLIYLNRTKFLNDRIMRWAMSLQSYPMRIESIKGSENVGADYLSRIY